ncbi:L-threonylcarbamoyladenylate synthase [uncultured Methanobrevibacter sp.]|uniref:L-threonylcarbamoyladenylate synthase n=1 Tax=uncultured Methanobrevibacter sp. TaxID=253161 RepID=UPI0025FE4261|nr:L-threonylcarbamoyladenylate synthase [uncultured Methanobrevibacter sp.]
MKQFKLNVDNPDMDLINKAIDILKDDGVILYPTDTIYGLGANIFSEKGVRRVYKIKQRSFKKPLSVSVSNFEGLSLIADISEENKKIMENYLPGPYTFLLKKRDIVPPLVTSYTSKVGVRIPDNTISRLLSMNFPITTTSANISDEEVLTNPEKIVKQLKGDVDLIMDIGPIKSSTPSTIIDLTKEKASLVRKGKSSK